jgi:energy-coupling factor transporter ATP-binding protein EcfA2
MWISRVRVTGGFLNGVDLNFTKGLNVVIGARGAGKTTLLELIRHAVGAQHADQRNARERQDFLSAVLGTGEVVVDIESDDGGRHLVVDAKGGGQRAELSGDVLVLGQNELEEIASDAASRLSLLDLRTGQDLTLPDRAEAADMTAELHAIRTELGILREEGLKRGHLVNDRALLTSQEAVLLGGDASHLSERRELLRQAEDQVIQSNRDLERIAEVRRDIWEAGATQKQQGQKLSDLLVRMSDNAQTAGAGPRLTEALSLSVRIEEALGHVRVELERAGNTSRNANIAAREQAAPIRAELDQAESGLGQITAQVRNIDAELKLLDENDIRAAALQVRYQEVSASRQKLLNAVEAAEERIYSARSAIAKETTAQIASNVVVQVEHLSNFEAFKAFLTTALRGSNTRSAMIDAVAERVLPRQLLEIVEAGDESGLAAIAGLTQDQSRRLIDNLSDASVLRDLVDVRLADSVDFRLRDGIVDKSVDTLSTGQKCAVTLPIILSDQLRTLILDQPEDHLDNAYLVENVVGGLQTRGDSGAQTIVATHNANIPVLGSAEKVVVLSSDGRNGTVDTDGPFDNDAVVESITGLMEGGREAFSRRSDFYSQHGGLG